MLLTKYIEKGNGHVTQLMNIIPKKIFKRSLQAQKESWQQKRKRALRFASCTGSVTVETALVLPVFLCVLCGLMLLGSLLLTEARIQYALSLVFLHLPGGGIHSWLPHLLYKRNVRYECLHFHLWH